MSKSKSLRDNILALIKGENKEMAVSEINGNYFSAVDVAIKDSSGNLDTFRIAIIEHGKQAE